MSKIKHNKKRNVGLVFDQLSRMLSESVIAGDTDTSKKCASIINEHFKKGTALHSEMRLFRSLSNVRINNDILILRVLDESRRAAKRINSKELAKEKTQLIKSLNEAFGKDSLFNMKNKRFRELASIQVLLNEWRKGTDDTTVSMLEDNLITEMKGNKDLATDGISKPDVPSVTSLVVEIAKKKFFVKHKSLSARQVKSLFEMLTSDDGANRFKAESTVSESIKAIDNYVKNESKEQSEYFMSTLREARAKLDETCFDSLSGDQIIVRTLVMEKLIEEINNE